MDCSLTIQLNENIEADVTVYFDCSYTGDPGDYHTTPQSPEFDITDVRVDTVYGSSYDKSRYELLGQGWTGAMDEQARHILLEGYEELYELQLDTYQCM